MQFFNTIKLSESIFSFSINSHIPGTCLGSIFIYDVCNEVLTIFFTWCFRSAGPHVRQQRPPVDVVEHILRRRALALSLRRRNLAARGAVHHVHQLLLQAVEDAARRAAARRRLLQRDAGFLAGQRRGGLGGRALAVFFVIQDLQRLSLCIYRARFDGDRLHVAFWFFLVLRRAVVGEQGQERDEVVGENADQAVEFALPPARVLAVLADEGDEVALSQRQLVFVLCFVREFDFAEGFNWKRGWLVLVVLVGYEGGVIF